MEISTVSNAEMVQLYSSFVYMTTDALNCSKTKERSNSKKAIIQHNCDFAYKRKIFELDDVVWNSCLCRFLHPNFNSLMVLNKQYEKGSLPESGGMLEQLNSTIERIEILDHLKNLHKEQQQKEQEKKNGRSQHRPPTKPGKREHRPPPSSRTNKPN